MEVLFEEEGLSDFFKERYLNHHWHDAKVSLRDSWDWKSLWKMLSVEKAVTVMEKLQVAYLLFKNVS